MKPSAVRLAGLAPAALLLGGCQTLSYYSQLARGQWELIARRQSIAELIADARTDSALRQRLQSVLQARRYASAALDLPDNRSYTRFVKLGRDYVVWNVFATPEFSLEAVESCFPIAGCLSYRGFYDRRQAQAHAARLQAQGLETHIGGVSAYSTLGWFDDPVLDTMMRWSDARLVGTLFHELAHQKLFVKNDTAFNESYASFVEQQGLREYRAALGCDDDAGQAAREAREREFVALVLDARQRLKKLYAEPLDAATMRARKAQEFERLRAEYRALRDGPWGGDTRYDAWFAHPLNNARLLPFGLYDQWVPAFARLWTQSEGRWPAFHAAVAQLAALDREARRQRLIELSAAAP